MPTLEGGQVKNLSAADKKKARKQKARQGKKALKEETRKVHDVLHRAQERESASTARGKTAAFSKHTITLDGSDTQVVVEYVPSPLTAIEELKNEADAAAIAANPYAALGGSDAGPSTAVSELNRIAKHFLPEDDSPPSGEVDNVTEEAVAGTDAVVKTGKDDEQALARKAAEEEAATKSNRMIKREKNEQTSQLIAQLKQECPRPEVVEVWDIRARDPKLLVFLKAYRNTVPVPRHWSQKRKYLQGKRGIEKPPFELPSYIQDTGIEDMRNALQEKVADKLKNKGKQRMRPKMGRMDIDYHLMQEAFFKKQVKPPLTGMGELYYEGKEYEMKASKAFPGVLSPELKEALSMSELSPPPWLINMQRYGPPPSYPSLKIPGLNAPIPPGTEFGYHPGGWGKPPVDANGMPLYGDVFGVNAESDDDIDVDLKMRRWGDLTDDDDETSDDSSEEEAPEEPLTQEQLEQGIASGMITGLASSLEGGIDTDATLDLRKQSGTATAGTPALYTVLQQEEVRAADSGLNAVGHTYKVPDAAAAGRKRPGFMAQGGEGHSVNVAVDPEQLERLGEKGMQQLYEQEAGVKRKEDHSDMIAAHAAARKRKQAEKSSEQAAKRAKDDFKF